MNCNPRTVETFFDLAIKELTVFPSISEIEEIAKRLGNSSSPPDRPTPVEFIKCFGCDGYGLVEMKHPTTKAQGYAACPECENGKKQEWYGNFNANKKPGESLNTCPNYRDALSWGFEVIGG